MAITPGRCPTDAAGLPLCPPFTEKDCIEVFKVYDQCVTEDALTRCVCSNDVCDSTVARIVSCSVIPDSVQCAFIGFGPFNPPFFRAVRVLQSVDVEVTAARANGSTCKFVTTLQDIVQAFMWAPEGTFVQCNILAVGDCNCEIVSPAPETQLICCTVKICKDIQVKALVKLLVPSYGFCEFQPCQAVAQPEFPCPPAGPIFPPQRCQTPPTVTITDAGTPAAGVTVQLRRNVPPFPVTINAVTDQAGVATFAEVGGFAGGVDQIIFQLTPGGKIVTFNVPLEFIDINGVAHDSATVCTITFNRVDTAPEQFEVFINNIQVQGLIDP
ncbi:MAG: hypothetical protein PHS52_03440 [Desulfotomaculaceae bacterium]|nr:hypothetical protein [Desulfotomaculaceae bacterium]